MSPHLVYSFNKKWKPQLCLESNAPKPRERIHTLENHAVGFSWTDQGDSVWTRHWERNPKLDVLILQRCHLIGPWMPDMDDWKETALGARVTWNAFGNRALCKVTLLLVTDPPAVCLNAGWWHPSNAYLVSSLWSPFSQTPLQSTLLASCILLVPYTCLRGGQASLAAPLTHCKVLHWKNHVSFSLAPCSPRKRFEIRDAKSVLIISRWWFWDFSETCLLVHVKFMCCQLRLQRYFQMFAQALIFCSGWLWGFSLKLPFWFPPYPKQEVTLLREISHRLLALEQITSLPLG